jgi:hypothetical protein
MFRSSRKCFGCFSLKKIIDPEMFQNASRIILGGTRDVLGLQKYFQIKRSLKNVFMNTEKHFMGWFLWGFLLEGIPYFWREDKVDGKVVGPPKRAANFVHGMGGPLGASFHHWVDKIDPSLCGMVKYPSPFWSFSPMASTPCSSYK